MRFPYLPQLDFLDIQKVPLKIKTSSEILKFTSDVFIKTNKFVIFARSLRNSDHFLVSDRIKGYFNKKIKIKVLMMKPSRADASAFV